MINFLLIILLCYLVGAFPTSIVTGRLLRGIDIREHGSGNAGGTNVFRVLGWKPGLFVMLFDAFKGFVATFWLSRLAFGTISLTNESIMLLCGTAAIVGHIWTVFAHFKGGKGVGTAAGMLVALYPLALLICLAIFFIVFLTTRIVSVGSLSAAIALPIVLTHFRTVFDKPVSNVLYVFSFFAAALIIFTHRSNIKRLLEGTENRFRKSKKHE
jgi:acyl phosphate:glycerol-3-phosphate acyltransferase